MPDEPISRNEDLLLRRWLKEKHSLQIMQFALWKMTPQEAVDYLQEIEPNKFKKLTAADLKTAARRQK